MNKHLIAVGLAVLAFGALPTLAFANTGGVTAVQDCYTYTARAFLDNNVSLDKTVTVITTIPGQVGLSKHFDTNGAPGQTEIWNVTGSAVTSGSVTLTIYNSDSSVDGHPYSASIPTPEGCPTPSPSPSPSPSSAPSSSPSSSPSPTPSSSHSPTPTPTGGTSPVSTVSTPSPVGQGGVLAASTTAPGLPVSGASPDDPNGGFMLALAVALVSVLAIAGLVKARR